MNPRIDYGKVAPEALAAMMKVESYARGSGIEHRLLELVKTRAALAWSEAVTKVGRGVHDDVYEFARAHFGEKELVDLTMAVVAINSWNRLCVAFGTVPGTYQPAE